MKRLKLIPQSWQPTDMTTPRAAKTPPILQGPTGFSPKTPPTEITDWLGDAEGAGSVGGRKRGAAGDVMQTPVIETMLGSDRLTKLRESLGNITQTPVRTLLPGRRENSFTPLPPPPSSSLLLSPLLPLPSFPSSLLLSLLLPLLPPSPK